MKSYYYLSLRSLFFAAGNGVGAQALSPDYDSSLFEQLAAYPHWREEAPVRDILGGYAAVVLRRHLENLQESLRRLLWVVDTEFADLGIVQQEEAKERLRQKIAAIIDDGAWQRAQAPDWATYYFERCNIAEALLMLCTHWLRFEQAQTEIYNYISDKLRTHNLRFKTREEIRVQADRMQFRLGETYRADAYVVSLLQPTQAFTPQFYVDDSPYVDSLGVVRWSQKATKAGERRYRVLLRMLNRATGETLTSQQDFRYYVED